MDRQHRRDLRHDKFVDELGILSGKAKENQRGLALIAGVAVAIALIGYGIYFFRSNRERKAQDLLSTAIDTIESPVAAPGVPPDPRAKFKSEAERTATAEKQFKDVKAQYGGTDAADIAGLYLARIDAARGDATTARTLLQDFIKDHPKHLLVGSARYSLYQLRMENGEASQVANEINGELSKQDPVLPSDSLLVLLAHAYDVEGNQQKSRDTYRRIVTEYPDSPFALEAQRRIGA